MKGQSFIMYTSWILSGQNLFRTDCEIILMVETYRMEKFGTEEIF